MGTIPRSRAPSLSGVATSSISTAMADVKLGATPRAKRRSAPTVSEYVSSAACTRPIWPAAVVRE